MDDPTFPHEGLAIPEITGPDLFFSNWLTIFSDMQSFPVNKIGNLRNRKSSGFSDQTVNHRFL